MKNTLCLLALTSMQQLSSAQNAMVNNGAFLQINNGSSIYIVGDLLNAGDYINNGTIHVTGDLTNSQVINNAGSGNVYFSGNTPQTLTGSATFLANNVVIDNAAGVTMNNVLKVSGQCNFNLGIINASNLQYPVTFTSSATITNISNSSHVNGGVIKEGQGLFTFPIGDGNRYQPVSCNLSVNTSGMKAQYHASDAGSVPYGTGGFSPTPLIAKNNQEYWDIYPIAAATGTVTVFWDDYNNTGISDTVGLRVAHLHTGLWQNEGGTSFTGNSVNGSVTSGTITSWSPITLGSTSYGNPLPLHLLSFDGFSEKQNNILTWEIATIDEQMSFLIERSENGKTFIPIGQEKGTSANSYRFIDESVGNKTFYYRIIINNAANSKYYSNVLCINRNNKDDVIKIYPNPGSSIIHIDNIPNDLIGSDLNIIDVTGRIILSYKQVQQNFTIDIVALAAGNYFLCFRDRSNIMITKK